VSVADRRQRAQKSGVLVKKIHILIPMVVSVASISTATAATPQQSGYSNHPAELDIRPGGNTDPVDTRTASHSIAITKVDACAKNGEYPSASCSQPAFRRSRRTVKQANAKSDPRRWISTLGF
jgi:hypothetical protein